MLLFQLNNVKLSKVLLNSKEIMSPERVLQNVTKVSLLDEWASDILWKKECFSFNDSTNKLYIPSTSCCDILKFIVFINNNKKNYFFCFNLTIKIYWNYSHNFLTFMDYIIVINVTIFPRRNSLNLVETTKWQILLLTRFTI